MLDTVCVQDGGEPALFLLFRCSLTNLSDLSSPTECPKPPSAGECPAGKCFPVPQKDSDSGFSVLVGGNVTLEDVSGEKFPSGESNRKTSLCCD